MSPDVARPEPPEDAARFVVGRKWITVAASKLEGTEHEPDGDTPQWASNAVTFEEGDELPPDVAREMYPAFHDRIMAFDDDDQRVDDGLSSINSIVQY